MPCMVCWEVLVDGQETNQTLSTGNGEKVSLFLESLARLGDVIINSVNFASRIAPLAASMLTLIPVFSKSFGIWQTLHMISGFSCHRLFMPGLDASSGQFVLDFCRVLLRLSLKMNILRLVFLNVY